ncbi:MAG: hypothetical protein QOF26_1668 [Baekduia sp.]|nr:hypothetical protein [Baekduia sp.]
MRKRCLLRPRVVLAPDAGVCARPSWVSASAMLAATSRLAAGPASLALAALALAAPTVAPAAVRVDGPLRAPLPNGFAGISVETDTLGTWFAPGGCRSPARDVLRLLGRPEIRVGGNSQDRLWPHAPLPSGQQEVAAGPYFHGLRCLAATGSPLLVGLNLLGRDAQATGDLLSAVESVVPARQLAIAVGNEPNLYGGRLPSPGAYDGYLQLYGQTIDALLARFGGHLPPLAGPDAATWRWRPETVRFLTDAHPSILDAHLYGLNGCRATPGAPGFPSVAGLLAPGASTDLVAQLGGIAAAARGAGITAQLSEVNSVACRGISGVSDHPASALWALSVLGSAAVTGFDRVQFHMSNGNYDPFVPQPDGTVAFHPLMTAMVLADRLWPAGTRPMHLRGALPPGVGAWAARRPGGDVGIVVVNRDMTHGRRVTLRTAGGRATAGRLRGAGGYAVTLDGQQLAWAHGAPVWRGHRTVHRLPVRHGHVTVALAPLSAAWLRLGGRPAGAARPAAS